MGSIGSTIKLIQDYQKHDISFTGGSLRYSVQNFGKDIIYIHGIEVEQEQRGHGVGTKLLNKIKDMANKNGMDIELFAVPIHNSNMSTEELVKWYERNGFVEQADGSMRYRANKRS